MPFSEIGVLLNTTAISKAKICRLTLQTLRNAPVSAKVSRKGGYFSWEWNLTEPHGLLTLSMWDKDMRIARAKRDQKLWIEPGHIQIEVNSDGESEFVVNWPTKRSSFGYDFNSQDVLPEKAVELVRLITQSR